MKYLLPILAIFLLCSCAKAGPSDATAPTAAASTPAPASSAAIKATVQQALTATGITVRGPIDAPAGYRGFVGVYQGQELPVYALPDGKHVMIGSLLDLHGQDLTAPALAAVAGSGITEEDWQSLAKSTWFVEGNPNGKRIVYAFEDTRCPYCHMLWQQMQPYLKRDDVQVRTIIVAVISPSSLPEGAKILAAKDRAAAWNRNEENFGKNPEPKDDAPAEAVAQVRANTAMFQGLGFAGTPSVVWKDAKGSIHALQGAPRDPKALDAIFEG